jgi:hypothetical protein
VITTCQERQRASTERTLRRTAAAIHFHCTKVNASPTAAQSGPRHASSTTTTAKIAAGTVTVQR